MSSLLRLHSQMANFKMARTLTDRNYVTILGAPIKGGGSYRNTQLGEGAELLGLLEVCMKPA